MSKLYKCVSLSTIEVEYVAMSKAGNEMVWLTDFLEEIGKRQHDNYLFSDYQSAMQL